MDGYIGNKNYIDVDTRSRITDGWSDGPHPERDTTRTICINNQVRISSACIQRVSKIRRCGEV